MRGVLSVLVLLAALPVHAAQERVEAISRVDAALLGVQSPNGNATTESKPDLLSTDGRFALFATQASNLDASVDDVNGATDVWIADRQGGKPVLASRAFGVARTANAASRPLALSHDGNFALFASFATDLVNGQSDTNAAEDIFLFDRATATVRLISRRTNAGNITGNGASTDATMSGNGSVVLFQTDATDLIASVNDANNASDVYLHVVASNATQIISTMQGSFSQTASARTRVGDVSDDGIQLALLSDADDLLAGQVTSSFSQLFVFSRFGTRALASHAAGLPLQPGSRGAQTPRFSPDGEFVVYGSDSNNLVTGQVDTNNAVDVFLHVTDTGANELVSFVAGSPATTPSTASQAQAFVSSGGQRIAFASAGAGLVAGFVDGNGTGVDVYLHERGSGTRTLVSHRNSDTSTSANGTSLVVQGLSDDGKRLLFRSQASDLVAGQVDATANNHLFLFDLASGSTTLVTHTAGSAVTASSSPVAFGQFSPDGSTALFTGGSDDHFAGDDNQRSDTFAVRNGVAQQLTLADPAASNARTAQGGGLASARAFDDRGRYVAFASGSEELLAGSTGAPFINQFFLRDRADDSVLLITHAASGQTVKSAGQTVGFGPVISGDGEWAVFLHTGTDLVAGISGVGANAQVYQWSRSTGETRLVSHAAGAPLVAGNGAASGTPSVSADGRFVAYVSRANNLVAGQTGPVHDNLYLHDAQTGTTTLVNHAASSATLASAPAQGAFSMSPDGAHIAFASNATDLVALTDTNNNSDVFLHLRASGTNLLVSRSGSAARTANLGSGDPDVSADGNFVVFRSGATDLLPGTPVISATSDIFRWRRSDDSMRLVSHAHADPLQHANTGMTSMQASDDARRVVFLSSSTDLVAGFSSPHGQGSLFSWDADTDTVVLVDRAAGSSTQSGDALVTTYTLADGGSHVAFASRAANLVVDQADTANTVDLFHADLATRTVRLASHKVVANNAAGTPLGAPGVVPPAITRDGLLMAFRSDSNDIARNDTNNGADAFLYIFEEPTRTVITDVSPSPSRVGESYVVSVELDVSDGPAVGHVVVSDGTAQCEFDIVAAADSRGSCELVSATAGNKTLTAQFTSTAGFGASSGTRPHSVLPPLQSGLSIALSAPAIVATGATFALAVDVANAGPDATPSARVDFSGLPGVASFSGSGWTCDAAPTFACTSGTLAPGAAPTLVLQLVAPAADASLSLQASVSSPQLDTDATDNARVANVLVDSAPQVTQISPLSGNTEGGYPLQVSGANFGTATGSVDLDGTSCPVTVWTATQIVCTVPPGAGVRGVRVIQAASALDRTTFASFAYAVPSVSSVAPVLGAAEGGYPITLDGSNFGGQGATVSIGGAACTQVGHDAVQPHRKLTCTVPAGTGSNLPVVVTQSAQSSNGAARFAYASVLSDLLIDKSSTRTEVFARGVEEWTLLVSNLGPDAATGARVLDQVPPHLANVSWTCLGLAGASCGTSAGLGNVDVLVDLPPGGSALVQISARIPRAPLLDLVNTATVTLPAGQADPVQANNSDTETDRMATVFFDDFE